MDDRGGTMNARKRRQEIHDGRLDISGFPVVSVN